MRNPTPGQSNCVWFFRPEQRQLQRLSWQASQGRAALPHQAPCIACALQALEGVAGLPGWPCSSADPHSWPSAFVWGPLYLGPSTEAVLRHLCENLLTGESGENLKTHLCILAQGSGLLTLSPLSPLGPQVKKTSGTFCLRLPQQWGDHYFCADPPALNQGPSNMGKR